MFTVGSRTVGSWKGRNGFADSGLMKGNAHPYSHNYKTYHYNRNILHPSARIVLFFDTTHLPGDNVQKMRAVVASRPVNALFAPPVWYEQHPSGIVVSTMPTTINSVAMAAQQAPDMQIGVTLGAEVSQRFQWSYAELEKKCQQLERLVGCQDCPYKGKECAAFITSVGAGEVRTHQDFQDFDVIDEYLRSALSSDLTWRYVPPNQLRRNPFTKRTFIEVGDLSFDFVESRREDAQERATKSAETRRWRTRCQQCVFAHYCPGMTDRRCSWGLRECFENNPVSGPFTQQELDAYLETYPFALSRDKVEFLVRNSGVTRTRLFGGTYQLSRLEAPSSTNVIWERVGRSSGPPFLSFSFEDTMRIIRTPYRHERAYRYPKTYEGVALTNEQLHLYAAVCEKGGVSRGRRRGWGDSLLEAHFVGSAYDSALTVHDARGNRVCLKKYASLLMYDYQFPPVEFSIFVRHLRLAQESQGVGGNGGSGTQLGSTAFTAS